MAKQVKVLAECKDCGGTGLYTGMNCHEGATNVCISCGGTGAKEISYTPFTGRNEKKGVKRVFSNASWRALFTGKHVFDDGTMIDFSKYGCSYEDWKKGAEPKPLP